MDNCAKKTVLVVDDASEDIDILVNILSTDYQVKVALNGQKALQFLSEKSQPDLVLLDILMPGIDGYKVCEAIKADKKLQDIPVIFISALDNLNDIIHGFEAGGVDYITKPFQPEEVRARVTTHIQIKEYQHQLEIQNRQLEDNYRTLQDLEKQRDNLTHMIVHDMRTPLQTVMGYLELLKYNENLDDEDTMYIHKMRECCDGLADMVNSLLDVSRLESNKIPLQFEQINLSDMLNKVVTDFCRPEGSARIITDIAPCDATLTADPLLIERIVINLLSNACKFTPQEGLITLSMNHDTNHFSISVADTGEGISPDEHTKIFEKFEQAVLRKKRHKYSSGLGLTFCKLAVEAHGGTIRVESSPGHGSKFTFELPTNQQ